MHQGWAGGDLEYGVVVQSDSDSGNEGFDYYVACFGASVPAGPPTSAPSILHVPAKSLERVEGDPRKPIWERRRKPGFSEKLMKSRIFWAFLVLLKVGITIALIVALAQRWSCH
jgi:hypothetical protein